MMPMSNTKLLGFPFQTIIPRQLESIRAMLLYALYGIWEIGCFQLLVYMYGLMTYGL